MQRIPLAEEAFEALGSVKGLWYESLDSATLATSEHFRECNHRYDHPQLFANHVRSKMLEILEPEAEKYGFAIVSIAGGEFLLTYKHFACKFYKAFDGRHPLPDDTKSNLSFYKWNSDLPFQPALPGLESSRIIPAGTTINLIAYYDITAKFELAWFRIACPRLATSSSVKCFWDKEVENPLYSGEIPAQTYSMQQREDLTFTFREDDDSSTELAQ